MSNQEMIKTLVGIIVDCATDVAMVAQEVKDDAVFKKLMVAVSDAQEKARVVLG